MIVSSNNITKLQQSIEIDNLRYHRSAKKSVTSHTKHPEPPIMDHQIFLDNTQGLFSDRQMEQFALLGDLYTEWNAKINVISRRDIDNLYLHHVLHSLAIEKFLGKVENNTRFLDLGTGGGFPGIPLAIAYPESTFLMVDRIGKKLRVAEAVAKAVGLTNVEFKHGDVGEVRQQFDYVVSRAVMRLDALIPLVRRLIDPKSRNHYANGLICLKGGDIADESIGINLPVIDYPIRELINDPWFDTKNVVYVPMALTKNK